jgi:alkylation response protein AidB-like acyl-CoA dehydrogenase
LATELDAARLLVYRAANLKDQGKPFTTEAAMAKKFAGEMAMKVATKGVQMWGGYGYMMESPMQRHFRDAKIMEIYEGTSEMMKLIIARSVIS